MTIESKRVGGGYMLTNDRKTTNNHPDYKGPLEVNGVEYDVAGWIAPGRDGRTLLKLKVKKRPDSGPVVVQELQAAPIAEKPAVPQGEP